MVGTPTYTREQIRFILWKRDEGRSHSDISALCNIQFRGQGKIFNREGCRYVCNTYNEHPEYRRRKSAPLQTPQNQPARHKAFARTPVASQYPLQAVAAPQNFSPGNTTPQAFASMSPASGFSTPRIIAPQSQGQLPYPPQGAVQSQIPTSRPAIPRYSASATAAPQSIAAAIHPQQQQWAVMSTPMMNNGQPAGFRQGPPAFNSQSFNNQLRGSQYNQQAMHNTQLNNGARAPRAPYTPQQPAIQMYDTQLHNSQPSPGSRAPPAQQFITHNGTMGVGMPQTVGELYETIRKVRQATPVLYQSLPDNQGSRYTILLPTQGFPSQMPHSTTSNGAGSQDPMSELLKIIREAPIPQPHRPYQSTTAPGTANGTQVPQPPPLPIARQAVQQPVEQSFFDPTVDTLPVDDVTPRILNEIFSDPTFLALLTPSPPVRGRVGPIVSHTVKQPTPPARNQQLPTPNSGSSPTPNVQRKRKQSEEKEDEPATKKARLHEVLEDQDDAFVDGAQSEEPASQMEDGAVVDKAVSEISHQDVRQSIEVDEAQNIEEQERIEKERLENARLERERKENEDKEAKEREEKQKEREEKERKEQEDADWARWFPPSPVREPTPKPDFELSEEELLARITEMDAAGQDTNRARFTYNLNFAAGQPEKQLFIPEWDELDNEGWSVNEAALQELLG